MPKQRLDLGHPGADLADHQAFTDEIASRFSLDEHDARRALVELVELDQDRVQYLVAGQLTASGSARCPLLARLVGRRLARKWGRPSGAGRRGQLGSSIPSFNLRADEVRRGNRELSAARW